MQLEFFVCVINEYCLQCMHDVCFTWNAVLAEGMPLLMCGHQGMSVSNVAHVGGDQFFVSVVCASVVAAGG
jgi:hypothetical protein